jgi:DNA-binding NarL/FixJ family response regulator
MELLKKDVGIPIMAVYSIFNDYAHVNAAMSMGVRAYITKRRGAEELEAALEKAIRGEIYIDEEAQTRINNTENLLRLLSNREREILFLVKSGHSNREIAAKIGISRRTVENILSCVYDKTGIRSRLELERL